MTWIPATAGFEIGQEIIDPATSEKWIVLNVGRVWRESTFLHLKHTTKTQPGWSDHPVQRGCLVNRTTGEHTKSPW
jgi:hypothetical protein